MNIGDFLICTFEGDTATPPNTFVGEITSIDPANEFFSCQMVDTGQRYTFQYSSNTSGPWHGQDDAGVDYSIDTHDVFTAGNTDPSPQGVAVVTFADNNRYLCFVESISPNIDVIFYHQPYPRLSFDGDEITISNWDTYVAGDQIISIEGCVLSNEISRTGTPDAPDPIDEVFIGADAPTRPYGVESWRPLVTEMAGDIPVEVLLRWIKHESGGNPCSTGKIVNGASIENGLFQLYHPDDDHIATPTQLHGSFCNAQRCIRDLTLQEARVQVASGIAYVRICRERARAQLKQGNVKWDEMGTDFWSLVKMQHNLPSVPVKYIPKLKPSSWAEFKEGVIKEHPEWSDSRSTIFTNAEDIGDAAE